MPDQESQIKSLLKALAQRPIAYQKIYTLITGSITAGLLLSQIVYWWYSKEREFYKTDKAFRDELAMSHKEFKTAKSKLKKLKLITTAIRGVPRKTFYRLEESALLAQISNWAERDQLNGPKGTIQKVRKVPTITDNTQRLQQRKISRSSKADLSSKQTEQQTGMSLLLSRGIDEKVARSIVYEHHTPLSSIEEVIKNGLAKENNAQKTGGNFRLAPGYIVKALNQARNEGKEIGPTKLSKKLSAKIKSSKEPYKPLSKIEFDKSRKRQLAALKI